MLPTADSALKGCDLGIGDLVDRVSFSLSVVMLTTNIDARSSWSFYIPYRVRRNHSLRDATIHLYDQPSDCYEGAANLTNPYKMPRMFNFYS